MQYIRSIFGLAPRSVETPSQSEQGQVSILAVVDVHADKIDEQAKKVNGFVDLATVPFNGSCSEASFKEKWTCRYKNFFLGETKYTHYEDGEGNRITSNYIDSSGNKRMGFWTSGVFNDGCFDGSRMIAPKCKDLNGEFMSPENFLLLEEKELPDGRVKRKFVTKTAGKEYNGVKKVAEFGFTISDQTVSDHRINQNPEERHFHAFRVVHEGPISEGELIPWQKEPGVYENPNDLADFREFCRFCKIRRVVYPPSSPENQGKR